MEAKNTVIKPDELGLAIIKHPELPMGQAIAIEQAEMSFKAGEEKGLKSTVFGHEHLVRQARIEGIREVVEWIKENSFDSESIYALSLWQEEWQAKLKVWGIENG